MRAPGSLRDRIAERIAGALPRLALFAAVAFVGGIGSSCNFDPVHRKAVNALGPENADAYPPESAYHRPGEPCALCHSEAGPADSQFVLGGTIFWGPDSYENRVDKAYVRIIDPSNRERCYVTNCNGNFYVRLEDFKDITFPILVSVERTVDPGRDETEIVTRRMSSHIGREPSCATCHIQGIRDFASPGQIRLFNSEAEFRSKNIPQPACPPDQESGLVCPEDR